METKHYKTCSVCNIQKEATNEYFSKNGKCLNVKCKECSKEYSRLYHIANKERINKRQAAVKKEATDNLSDYYLKMKIKSDLGIVKHDDIPQELIELKRKQLKLHRYVRKEKIKNRKNK